MVRQMKDSEVEWIGEIPEEWRKAKMKQIGKYINGYAFKPENWTSKGKPIIRIQDLTGSNKNPNYYDGIIDIKYLVKRGDILVSWAATLDAFIWKGNEGWLNQHIFKALPNERIVNYEFFFWIMKIAMENMNNDNKHGIVMQHVTTEVFGNFFVPIPSLTEQQKIADFLDEKVAEIDSAIEKTKATIEDYKKYKNALILQAISKGLDKTVAYTKCEIEWIDEIPKHWEVNNLSQIFFQLKNKNSDLIETNLLSLSYGKIKRKDINSSDGLLPKSFDSYNIIKSNDIVLRLTDLQNDHKSLRVGLATEKGIITSAYITLRCKKNIDTKYYYYFLHAFDICKGFYGMGAGVRQGLNYEGIKSLKIVTPPLAEQEEIAKYLDMKCLEIDKLIIKKEELIKELENYKKSLIYECVTGKREV